MRRKIPKKEVIEFLREMLVVLQRISKRDAKICENITEFMEDEIEMLEDED